MSGLDVDEWAAVVQRAQTQLESAGLDLVRWFSVVDANQALEAPYRLPDSGSVGLILGNTRALWEPFLRSKSSRPNSRHPLDHYVEDATRAALEPLHPRWLRFSHQMLPAPIPIQRYAALSGLAQMSPVGLSIHPDFGPWIALRAVAVFDAPNVPAQEPRRAHPCELCPRPCVAPFERALGDPARNKRSFLPVRLSCPVGTECRYGEDQIDYHYGPPLPGAL